MTKIFNVSFRTAPTGRCIKDMCPGDVGYVVPWALNVDGVPYLNGDFCVYCDRGGTAEMRIERTEDEFVVDTEGCDKFHWRKV